MKNKKPTLKETFNLALENHKKKEFRLAKHLYQKILSIDPFHFGSIFYLGTLEAQLKNFFSAKELFKKATEIKPTHVGTYINLGATYQMLGNFQEAKASFAKAIELQPNNPAAHNNLGAILKETGELTQAISECEKAITIEPNYVSAHRNLGLIFQELREIKKAINCFEILNKLKDRPANTLQNLGRLHVIIGDNKKAIEYYENAIKLEPENLLHYYNLYNLKKEILNLDLKKKINKILENKESTKKNIAYGNFLLASSESENRNHKKEFDYLIKGHSYFLESENENYKKDINYWLNTLPEIEELKKFNKFKKNIGNLKPIFIVGVPRSGSTLVEKLIASGPQSISIGEETGVLSNFIKQKLIEKKTIISDVENMHNDIYRKFSEKGLVNEKNNFFFTDKTLDNFFYISLIKEIFPHAKVINCKRSPLSSIVSILKNNLPAIPWAHDMKDIFKYFDIYYKKIEHFNKIYPNFIYELDFEKLSNDPENESKKLMKYCNLAWDKKCLEFYKRKDLISKTTSNLQIRKAIYGHSVEKYLPYKQLLSNYGDNYSWFC